MTALPRISNQDIQSHVGAQTYQRGQAYADQGRIIATRRRGDTIRALCLGSVPVPYRLQATIGDGGAIQAQCTCPVGASGHCKHVAALLLTWRSNPDAFIEAADLESALADRSKEELVELLITMATGNPQFEQLLETAAGLDRNNPAKGADFYRQQVEAAIMPLDAHWDFSTGGYGYGAEVPAIVEQGDEMLPRENWSGAAAVYRGVLGGVSESDALTYDEEGSLVEAVWHCIAGLGTCLEHLDEAGERAPIIDTLFETYYVDIVEYGGIDLSIGAPDILITRTTSAEREALMERVREAMPSEDEWGHEPFSQLLLELETEQLEGEAYLDRTRELGFTDRVVERLLSLGRTEEAVEETANAEPSELEMLVPIFIRHDQEDLVEPLVQRHLAGGGRPNYVRIGGEPVLNLERWLIDRYRERGEREAALPLALNSFRTMPRMSAYQEVREMAHETGDWESLRPELLAELDERAPDLKVQIYLEEGELDEAIAGAREIDRGMSSSFYGGNDVRLMVAQAAESDRPEAALEFYLGLADQLIDERGRENYQVAAAMLGRARNLLDRLDRFEEWETHIARVRSDHHRLPALQDELNRAEL